MGAMRNTCPRSRVLNTLGTSFTTFEFGGAGILRRSLALLKRLAVHLE